MIHAYDKIYLTYAQTSLGRMFDFVVYDMQYKIEEYIELFLKSAVSDMFASGDYEVLVGMSGVELTYMVLDSLNIDYNRVTPKYTLNRSEEYWMGWALAYYQWKTNLSFKEIFEYIDALEIISLYTPYHEMDIQQFVDKMNDIYRSRKKDTNLKIYRKQLSLSQKELSELSGIPIRTLQQYEQRQKNINKAQVEYLVSLAKVLCCEINNLLEKV